jgi:acyl-CoA synthetase (AMP-forming)/AMP-acid ligase II
MDRRGRPGRSEKAGRRHQPLRRHQYFGSPALLDTLSSYCVDNGIRLESVTRVISAGAAVPVSTIRRMQRSLYRDAQVHTPYGATECLPVSSISGAQFDDKLVDRIESGDGVCVGRPLEPNQVRIIRISEMAFRDLSETTGCRSACPANRRHRAHLHRHVLAAGRRHRDGEVRRRARSGTAWATWASWTA